VWIDGSNFFQKYLVKRLIILLFAKILVDTLFLIDEKAYIHKDYSSRGWHFQRDGFIGVE
jgi:hypothetical protein